MSDRYRKERILDTIRCFHMHAPMYTYCDLVENDIHQPDSFIRQSYDLSVAVDIANRILRYSDYDVDDILNEIYDEYTGYLHDNDLCDEEKYIAKRYVNLSDELLSTIL